MLHVYLPFPKTQRTLRINRTNGNSISSAPTFVHSDKNPLQNPLILHLISIPHQKWQSIDFQINPEIRGSTFHSAALHHKHIFPPNIIIHSPNRRPSGESWWKFYPHTRRRGGAVGVRFYRKPTRVSVPMHLIRIRYVLMSPRAFAPASKANFTIKPYFTQHLNTILSPIRKINNTSSVRCSSCIV